MRRVMHSPEGIPEVSMVRVGRVRDALCPALCIVKFLTLSEHICTAAYDPKEGPQMKKLLKVLLGIAVIVVLGIAAVFYFTSDMSRWRTTFQCR